MARSYRNTVYYNFNAVPPPRVFFQMLLLIVLWVLFYYQNNITLHSSVVYDSKKKLLKRRQKRDIFVYSFLSFPTQRGKTEPYCLDPAICWQSKILFMMCICCQGKATAGTSRFVQSFSEKNCFCTLFVRNPQCRESFSHNSFFIIFSFFSKSNLFSSVRSTTFSRRN